MHLAQHVAANAVDAIAAAPAASASAAAGRLRQHENRPTINDTRRRVMERVDRMERTSLLPLPKLS